MIEANTINDETAMDDEYHVAAESDPIANPRLDCIEIFINVLLDQGSGNTKGMVAIS